MNQNIEVLKTMTPKERESELKKRRMETQKAIAKMREGKYKDRKWRS